MDRKIRFGSYIREITIRQKLISYNDLVPEIQQDANGIDIPYIPPKLKLRNIDIYRLVQPLTDSQVIMAGLVSVIIGLMMFMEGLKVGLMPFGETIGNSLPTKSPLYVVLTVTFLLGIGVTFAEPAIGALKTAGSIVDVTRAPYLYTLLNEWSDVLVLIIGMGVGLAAVLGTLRFIYGWSMKPFIYCTMVPTLGLTLYIMSDPELAKTLGLAWDCGAVTTGPVTVPLVLSLGIGIASSAGKGHSSLSGFGIVTLASLFPIIGVMILAIFVSSTTSVDLIIANAAQLGNAVSDITWYESTPWQEMILGVQAIVPLVLFLIFVMYFILNEKIKHKAMMIYGISLCVVGMVIFNIGLSYGLAKLGGQSGGLVPAAFTDISLVANSPLYSLTLGISIAALFAWFLGLGATLAEPALNALGTTVENLTNGAFRKSMLMYSVSIGVAFGIAIGVLKIIFDVPIAYLLLPGYVLGLILTALSTEEFVNIAWDSAGVTTGPVTVPLVLAMGLGFGNAMGSVEGFGILSMASICPIIAVLSTGLWVQWKINRRHQAESV